MSAGATMRLTQGKAAFIIPVSGLQGGLHEDCNHRGGAGCRHRNRLRVTLTGMTGNDDLMAEAGIGAGQGGIFGTAGDWVPDANLGGDYCFTGDFEGYVGLHRLQGPDRSAAVILAP